MNYLLVFIGGGLGSMLRHAVNVDLRALFGTAFPYHTFIVNITGSIVMGLIAGYLAFKGEASQPWRLFLMTGILGGYTTFSAFSLDAVLLYERGEIGLALFYMLGSVVLSIAGLFAGLALVRYRDRPEANCRAWPHGTFMKDAHASRRVRSVCQPNRRDSPKHAHAAPRADTSHRRRPPEMRRSC